MSELENTPSRRGGARPGAGKKKSHPEDKLEQRTMELYPRQWRKLETDARTAGVSLAALVRNLINQK
jgi:hypothetical protein